MQSIFDMTLLDSMLVQSALRALALALVVGAGLTLLRIRNPHHQLTAWTAVLVGALAMPVLMMWMVVSVPMEETVLPAGKIAESLTSVFSLSAEAASAAETPARLDGALETSAPFNWAGLALAIYGVVAGVLLLRLTVGLVLTARIRAQAVRIGASWTGGSDIRTSQAVMAPVTVGSTILLPADFESWSDEKRTAVLLHERAHVARGDFYVQIFAGLHRAVFWFSPMAWWLNDRLAELAEDASDAEAAAGFPYRAEYAAVLLDFAQAPVPSRLKFVPLAVAMARPATVRRRIERVLEDKGLPTMISRGARTATAMVVIVAACATAVSVVRTPANAAAGIDMAPLAPTPAAPPAAARALVAPAAPAPVTRPLVPGAPLPYAPAIHVHVPPVDLDVPEINLDRQAVSADPSFDADMKELRDAIAAAKAAGGDADERVAARLETAAERAAAKIERAAERRAERAERMQNAAAPAPGGPITKETRSVEAFEGVSFGGSGKVFITVGSQHSVVLESDAATLSRVHTEVDSDGVLRIRQRGDDSFFSRRADITAYITLPALRSARVSGAGDLKVSGLNGGQTDLSISGSGKVEAAGNVQDLNLSISGSGDAEMEKLVVSDAKVAISGSGSAVLDVRENLDVRVSGSGSVRYLTQPKDIDTSISGSGSVRRRDAT